MRNLVVSSCSIKPGSSTKQNIAQTNLEATKNLRRKGEERLKVREKRYYRIKAFNSGEIDWTHPYVDIKKGGENRGEVGFLH